MSIEKIRISCTGCGLAMLVPTSTIGKKIRCKRCKNTFVVSDQLEKGDARDEAEEESEDDPFGLAEMNLGTPEREEPYGSQLPPIHRPLAVAKSPEPSRHHNTERCPLPGGLFEILVPDQIHKDSKDDPSPFALTVGVGYWIVFALLLTYSLNTAYYRAKFDSYDAVSMVVRGILLCGVLTVLHFTNHLCSQLAAPLRRKPEYYVSSIAILQLAVTPIILLASITIAFAIPEIIETMGRNDLEVRRFAQDSLNDSARYLFLIPALVICRVSIGVFHRPEQLGIGVRADATPAETVLAIAAAVTRGPLVIVDAAHSSGLVAAIGALLTMLVIQNSSAPWPLLGTIALILTLWAIAFVAIPVLAIVFFFLNIFWIDVLQSFFKLVRNTSKE